MEQRLIDRALMPQNRLDLIIEVDLARETIDVRSTIIYDFDEDDNLVVAQTSPPVLKSKVGRQIEVTFTVFDPERGQPRRFGYQTKIIKYIPDYEIRSGVVEPALVITLPKGKVRESAVRLHVRVQPTADHEPQVRILETEGQVNLVDISLGGLLMSYVGPAEFASEQHLDLELSMMRQKMPLRGKVIRAFDQDRSKFVYIAFQFQDLTPDQTRLIQEMVNRIMRDELQARSRLD